MAVYHIKQLDRESDKDYANWKMLLNSSFGSTIFHNPDFLAYHCNRFKEHHLGVYNGDTLMGVMPMALFEENGKTIAKSPYGASYGGFVFNRVLNYSDSKKIVTEFKEYLKTNSIHEIIITPPLPIYYSTYSETFLFALLQEGFKIINSDITSVIDISENDLGKNTFTSRARNMSRKAIKAGVTCHFDAGIDDFWLLMSKTFIKHGTKPTHTFENWKWLMENLPGMIWCDVAYVRNIPIAGIGHFKINNLTDSSFYLCNDLEYQDTQALSLLICEILKNAQHQGYKWFDFGTSSVNMVARENIFSFKESFGSVGLFRSTYKVEL
jgi:lipid II:glycine glycyltransferase (peptidoglycan interpeptide bridge formation enzyme)